ncbi:MAG: hypothetical protein KDC12_01255 [Flavobacteriales bacterium]|nr:hypothetical protein [Flavobacteriales bacterium]
MRAIIVISIFLMWAGSVFAQSNRRELRVAAGDTVKLDSLSVAPHTFTILCRGIEVDSSLYTLYPISSLLVVSPLLKPDSVDVSFQVFPYDFSVGFFNKDTTLIGKANDAGIIYTPTRIRTNDPFLDEGELNKTGSISRGISFGNNQDLSVNSSLDLQLSGRLTDNIQVLASVTDNNIPIQPEGNTQQLQDFDQVYIQLFNDKFRLTAGDFQIRQQRGRFLQYYKRAQGATFSWYLDEQSSEKEKGELRVSAAVSKGKFARNVIQGIEGNQGPYRLNGSENEAFIIVLAGTERVYIDGKLLSRGVDADYIIDYNSAEVVFTPRQQITKDRRIIVEFQYSDKNYARSLIEGSARGAWKQTTWFVSAYSEQDSKNQPLQQDLTPDDRVLLAAAGDDLFSAFRSSIDSVQFADNLVLYELVDSLGYDSVLVYSTDPEKARYRAAFSEVGQGLGDYIQSGFSAVGRVYEWIAPDTLDGLIVHQGTHLPVIQLVAPRKRQGVNAGGTLNMKGGYHIAAEGAVSNTDLNTFSSVGNGDNVGFAGLVRLGRDAEALQSDTTAGWLWIPELGVEYNDARFRAIERFRAVEFDRNWNLTAASDTIGMLLSSAGIGLVHKANGRAAVNVENLQTTHGDNGTKLGTSNALRWGTTRINFDGSWLETRGARNTRFIRHESDVSHDFKYIQIGFQDIHELNRREVSDTLLSTSYRFYDWKAYLGSPQSMTNKYKIFYGERNDRLAGVQDLERTARAAQYGAELELISNRKHQVKARVSRRELKILNDELINLAPEQTIVGQLDHHLIIGKGWAQFNTFYQTGSGLEQKREFVYFEVPAGQGVYVWNDYNGDGVKDLDEFEIAQFSYEANYIRTFVQTADYVKIYSGNFNHTLQINPQRLGNYDSRVATFFQKFSCLVSYRSEQKTNRSLGANRFNPFFTAIADSDLVALNGTWRGSLFFNRSDTKYGLEYTYQDNRSKTLLTNGFESRGLTEHLVRFRWNLSSALSFAGIGTYSQKELTSDYLSNRNYALDVYAITPELAYQPSPNVRVALQGRYTEKYNRIQLQERAVVRKLGLTGRYSDMGKGSFTAELNALVLSYTGEEGNAISFEMLEGLTPGFNLTWLVGIQRKIAGNLQLNVNYNGRRGDSGRMIHQGGMQIRAFF